MRSAGETDESLENTLVPGTLRSTMPCEHDDLGRPRSCDLLVAQASAASWPRATIAAVSRNNAITRMRRGQQVAAARQRELTSKEGPDPEQAVAEALSAAAALAREGKWPAPRDPVSERAVEEVRARWVRIERRAKQTRGR